METAKLLKKEEGFSLIEMLVAMALFTLVISISITTMSIIGKTAKTVDYQVNVTQEASFGVERIRRLVRSADAISAVNESYLRIEVKGDVVEFTVTDGIIREKITKKGQSPTPDQSLMSSDVYIEQIQTTPLTPYFKEIKSEDGTTNIGVNLAYWVYDKDDLKDPDLIEDDRISGTLVSSQAISRNLILNQ